MAIHRPFRQLCAVGAVLVAAVSCGPSDEKIAAQREAEREAYRQYQEMQSRREDSIRKEVRTAGIRQELYRQPIDPQLLYDAAEGSLTYIASHAPMVVDSVRLILLPLYRDKVQEFTRRVPEYVSFTTKGNQPFQGKGNLTWRDYIALDSVAHYASRIVSIAPEEEGLVYRNLRDPLYYKHYKYSLWQADINVMIAIEAEVVAWNRMNEEMDAPIDRVEREIQEFVRASARGEYDKR